MHKSTTLFKISFFTFAFSLFTISYAQESKVAKVDSLQTTNLNIPNSIQVEEGDVKITDGTNTLIRITDEGTFGAIEIKNGVPSTTTDKLYNDGGTLKFDGSSLGGGSGTTQINDLSDAKTGGASVYLGTNAGTNDDGTDNRNTGLGQGTLATVTTGRYNVGLGYSALRNLETAEGNIGLGLNSLFSNSSGNYNIGLGQGSQYYLVTGSNNIGIGFRANINNTGGSNNTIIGHEAGAGAASHIKSDNVFIGFRAGYNETESNKLYIENSDSSSPLIWGDFATDSIKINGGLEVTSKTKTPLLQVTTGATDGHVLTSDIDGNATWQAPGDSGLNLSIGDTYQGGIIFWLDGSGEHGLIVAPSGQSIPAPLPWGELNVLTRMEGIYTGQANSKLIISINTNNGTTIDYAAKSCDDLVLNGYSDWYLPSIDELVLMLINIGMEGLGNFPSNYYYWSSNMGNAGLGSAKVMVVNLDMQSTSIVNVLYVDYDQIYVSTRAIRTF